jgi:hypothetical protein
MCVKLVEPSRHGRDQLITGGGENAGMERNECSGHQSN